MNAINSLTLDKTKEVVAQYLRQTETKDDSTPAPAFHLHSTKRKFGPVTAEVLTMTCPEHAATYLITVLCKLSEENKLPQGIFVPTGTLQLLGLATPISLLRQHNLYIANATMIAIEGIDEDVMLDSDLPINNSKRGTF